MTLLQSLAIKTLMLWITVGIIYWGVGAGDQQLARAPEPSVMSQAMDIGKEQPIVSGGPSADPNNKGTDSEEPLTGEVPAPADSAGGKVAVLAPADPVPSSSVRRAKSFLATPARRPVRFPLDLNKAPVHDLVELPGVGEKLAERIIRYRKEHGRFQSIEDLRKVRGIGKKRMERLRPVVTTAPGHD
ncbi:hypothetical protein BH18ACI3_BH18ACI3_08100 [soil metagenome]